MHGLMSGYMRNLKYGLALPGLVVHTWKTEAIESRLPGQPGLCGETLSQKYGLVLVDYQL
jgi:hypothetical protein